MNKEPFLQVSKQSWMAGKTADSIYCADPCTDRVRCCNRRTCQDESGRCI